MQHRKIVVAVIAALAGACSSTVPGPAASPAPTPHCAGGTVRSDAELARYEGCTKVVGDLHVQGVTTLESLSSLRSVTGTLQVGPTRALYDLSGLEQLRSVGELVLERNAGLLSARPLNGLTDAQRVRANRNPRLSMSFGFMNGVNRDSCSFELSRNAGLEAEGLVEVTRAKSGDRIGML